MKKKYILLSFALLFGLVLRIYFASFATNNLIWDMKWYDRVAKQMLSNYLVADCCSKNIGYAMFLSGIYRIFGVENLFAVRMIQVILDIATAILLYGIGRRLWGSGIATYGSVLYLLNPLTSSYTGYILPEIITIFSLAVLSFLLVEIEFFHKKLLWFLFGCLLGWLLFLRMSLYYFVLVVMGAIPALYFSTWKKRFQFFTLSMIGFLLISSYSLVSYQLIYGELGVVPPYDMRSGFLYMHFYNFNNGRYPELEYTDTNPKFIEVIHEFESAQYLQKREWSKKYSRLFWQKMRTDWPVFLRSYTKNMLWLWDKDHLFVYHDPYYPADVWVIRSLNSMYLLLFSVGVLGYWKKNTWHVFRQPLVIVMITLFFSISFLFPLVSNESRHSLLFYPFIFLWGGHGLAIIKRKTTVYWRHRS